MNLVSALLDKSLAYLLHAEAWPPVGQQNPLRPPWSSAAATFRTLCTGCGACAAACPKQLLVLGSDRLPTITFAQGACTFCGDCARSCPTGALQFEAATAPWRRCARVDAACLLRQRVLCRICAESCPHKAVQISPAAQEPAILPERCDGCGACAALCPSGAISFADNPPPSRSQAS